MKTVLLCSGGLDSTVLLFYLISSGYDVKPLFLSYGSKHNKAELLSARAVTSIAGVSLSEINLPALCGSTLTDSERKIPVGHYADPSMRETVVPNRNMIFLSYAASFAIYHKCESVSIASHFGDDAIYPDCRGAFNSAMRNALSVCHYEPILLNAPFEKIKKSDIIKIGIDVSAPIGLTWSCYNGRDEHCGECGTCNERIEAFRVAGVKDETRYKCI